jgi:hypothetical protein
MKVYILIRDVDYESNDVIRVCSKKKDAEKRLAFLKENQYALRSAIGQDKNPLWQLWKKEYISYPGDSYHLEEWEVT